MRRPEGPFAEFKGYYATRGDQHVFQVRHVSWRDGAMFHGLLCGSPEDVRLLEGTLSWVDRHGVVREDLDAGRLRQVLPRYAVEGGGLYLVYPSRRHPSSALRAFVELYESRLGRRTAR